MSQTRYDRNVHYNLNLSWKHMPGQIFDFARIEGLNGYGATLSGASFVGATIRNGSFNHAHLEGADFDGAALEGADMSGSQAQNAKMTYTDLSWSKLVYADLRNADLSNARLRCADMRWAKLENTKLHRANLANAITTGTPIHMYYFPGLPQPLFGCFHAVRVDDNFVVNEHGTLRFWTNWHDGCDYPTFAASARNIYGDSDTASRLLDVIQHIMDIDNYYWLQRAGKDAENE